MNVVVGYTLLSLHSVKSKASCCTSNVNKSRRQRHETDTSTFERHPAVLRVFLSKIGQINKSIVCVLSFEYGGGLRGISRKQGISSGRGIEEATLCYSSFAGSKKQSGFSILARGKLERKGTCNE